MPPHPAFYCTFHDGFLAQLGIPHKIHGLSLYSKCCCVINVQFFFKCSTRLLELNSAMEKIKGDTRLAAFNRKVHEAERSPVPLPVWCVAAVKCGRRQCLWLSGSSLRAWWKVAWQEKLFLKPLLRGMKTPASIKLLASWGP